MFIYFAFEFHAVWLLGSLDALLNREKMLISLFVIYDTEI